MLYNEAKDLMETYARNVWKTKKGNHDATPVDQNSTDFTQIAQQLESEFGIFAQVRGMQSDDIRDMIAVFYAGCDAWAENKEPFAKIPLQEFE